MKHLGKARTAAFNMILLSLGGVLALLAAGYIGAQGRNCALIAVGAVLVIWALFVTFTLYFFRDPTPRVPSQPGIVVSPGHGKVDIIDRVQESHFIGGECQRVSIFLSVFNVHVQNAPVEGKLSYYKYTTGQFLNAMSSESAAANENALLGFDSNGTKIGVRLIAGLIARRIIPFAVIGEEIKRGERISLIQFGSRVDVYLPMNAKVKVRLGDRVVGGLTVLAAF
jgi:phosphatidylserine decarboxylase